MTGQGLGDTSARWIQIRNTEPSRADVPAYGIVEIAGDSDSRGVYPVRMTTTDSEKMVLVLAGGNLPYGEQGTASWASPVPARYDPLDGTPQRGEIWGPAKGSWLLRRNQAGFRIFGTLQSNLVNVVRDPSAVQTYSSANGGGGAFGAVSWTAVTGISALDCNLIVETTLFALSTDREGGLLLVETPTTSTVALGPFAVVGTVTIPEQTGTVAGSAGSCEISGTVTVPEQTVSLDAVVACGGS